MGLPVAIIGSGNIGTDLMYKIERSDLLDLVAVIGIDPNSDGLARAKARGYEAPHNGIDWVSENPDAVGLVFDATSAYVHVKHNEVLHEHVVLLTIEVPQEPFVAPDARAEVKHLGKGIHQIILHYGFMDQPDVPRDLGLLVDRGIPFDPMRTSYFIGRNTYVEARTPIMARWQERLFIGMAHFASSASDFFGLPSNRVVELGSRIEV